VVLPHELLIVYDFEDDPTVPVARRLAQRWPHLRPTLNDLGRGVLNAIKVGFREAKGDAVLVTMADASDDPATIPAMCEKLAEGYDLVCASRYMRGGRQAGGPIVKSLLSRLAGLSLHWLAGIPTHDATNSFKLYRRRLLEEIVIESRGGFEVGLELTVKSHLRGYRIAELPTTWHDRREGTSNFKTVRWLPQYLRWYWLGIRGAGARAMHSPLSPKR
jgi:glycosyltransferase involved in cell wall biosynthesis